MTKTKSQSKPPSTEEVIAGMLKENTGKSILDSGDAYGRNWQRNQAREFEKEPEIELSFRWNEIGVTLNLYHWLKGRLEYNDKIQRAFESFATSPKYENEHWLACVREFVYDKAKKGIWTGLHGDTETGPLVYTYNHENLLSQDIQFMYFEVRGKYRREECGVLLQVHGGCDARGGLTKPKAFTLPHYSPECIFDFAHASIYADIPRSKEEQAKFEFAGQDRSFLEDPPGWDTDDGYHWRCHNHSKLDNLEEYDLSNDPADRGKDKIFVDEDYNGYCPVTGARLLAASWPCG